MPELLIDKLKDRVERLRRLYRFSMEAYHAYEEIQEYRNTATLDREIAHQHAEDIGKFKGFMVPAERGLSLKLHIELAKLFVPYQDGLHLTKLISFARDSQRLILESSTETDINGRPYPGLSAEEWQELQAEMAAVEDKVELLKNVRDKQAAHENLNHPKSYNYNTYNDFLELINLAERVLDKISVRFYGNTTMNEVYQQQVVDDTRALLQHISTSDRRG